MASTIITKNSSTASATPAVGDLQQGELAVNVTDKKIYTKDSSAAIVKLVGSLGNQEASAVAITGGSIAGITDLAVADGGTGSSTAAGARSNLSAAASGANSDITSLSGLTTALSVAQGGTGVTSSTGSGSVVLSNSPTLVTPALGTPSAAVLTNATGLPLSTGISGLGTGVATFLGTPSSANLLAAVTDETGTGALVFANSPTLVTPALGTPSSATLTNATGLPISTGVSGLGTGVATFLATPSSANLRSALTDETGTGSAVFATSPALVTPDLGTPSAATLTNATGLPISTGVSGLGTGVATALAVNVGSAGAPVVNGGALGTPSSGTVTNLTGTASININGTVGATTPTTGAFTTLTTSSTVTLNGGTANGVTYLNGSKVLTSGSALTFDGTNLGVGTTSPLSKLNAKGTQGNWRIDPDSVSSEIQLFATTTANDGFVNYRLRTNQTIIDAGGSEIGRFTSTGLGIGTSSPSSLYAGANNLVVGGGSGSTGMTIYSGTAGVGRLFFADGTSGADAYRGWVEYGHVGNQMTLGTNGATAATLDSSGNLGLGVTPSAWSLGKAIEVGFTGKGVWANNQNEVIYPNNAYYNGGWKYSVSSYAPSQYAQRDGLHAWYTAASGTAGNAITWTQAMTLDASGNLIVGGTTATNTSTNRGNITINGSSNSILSLSTGGTSKGFIYNDGTDLTVNADAVLKLAAGNTERARITSGGDLLVGTTSGTQRFVVSKEDSGAYVARFSNTTGSNANGVLIDTPNRAGSNGLYGLTVANSGGNAFAIYTDGTYGTISDINRKKNVETTRDGYLADLCSLRVVKYHWKEQEDSESKSLGFIAQEIEQVFAGLVHTDENGQKMVKQPVLIPMLVKALQELKAEFDAYKASHP